MSISTFDVGRSDSPLHIFRTWLELRREVRRLKPDLVHAQYGTAVGILATFSSRPAVISFCGSDLLPGAPVSPLRAYFGILLSNLAAGRASGLICKSEQLREVLWWRRNRAVVVPNGVDLHLFSPGPQDNARAALQWNHQRPVVLFNAGNSASKKGIDLAEAAMKVARLAVPEAALEILSNIEPDRMPLYYRAADVLLCTSRYEGSPNVVKEALACNLPVVSTPVGDVPERLAGVHPSAVVDRHPMAIGKALAEILLARERSNGREKVAHLSLEQVAQQVVAVYRQALGIHDQPIHSFKGPKMPKSAASDVTIVPMRADMVSQVARLHFDAFAGSMNTRMGFAYVRRFMDWFRRADRATALVAVDSHDRVIGYVVGAPLGYNEVMNRDLLSVAAVGMILRPWLFLSARFRRTVIDRLRLVSGGSGARPAEPELPEPGMSLVGIGVSPSARGRKVGLRLMEAFEARACELRMRALRLSVYPDNAIARQLYERCGWRPCTQRENKSEAMVYFRLLTEEVGNGRLHAGVRKEQGAAHTRG